MAENDTADLGSSENLAVDDLYRYTDEAGRKHVTARGSRAHLEHLDKLKLAALVEATEKEVAALPSESGEKQDEVTADTVRPVGETDTAAAPEPTDAPKQPASAPPVAPAPGRPAAKAAKTAPKD
ncbi:hypothetical protein [Rhodococcus sp. JVH1]|uniref:hypothetical protein n=1 Tax=Rhodococcus sp. JVH1 TaxID=745408 RepID=UPI0002720803|nr:hypothetical protein [Rhodococcus sp. JVH1]EJJ01040.1 hypothetical protein JVH1_1666 [Rhodococcus sp. JVH1]